jgi:hypothetical protein
VLVGGRRDGTVLLRFTTGNLRYDPARVAAQLARRPPAAVSPRSPAVHSTLVLWTRGNRRAERADRRGQAGRGAADELGLGLVAGAERARGDHLAALHELAGDDDVEALLAGGGGAVVALDVLDVEVAQAGARAGDGADLVEALGAPRTSR